MGKASTMLSALFLFFNLIYEFCDEVYMRYKQFLFSVAGRWEFHELWLQRSERCDVGYFYRHDGYTTNSCRSCSIPLLEGTISHFW